MATSLRSNPMDAAADKAVKELTQKVVANMTPKERDGAQAFIDWLTTWKSSAGYRRLGRYLVTLKVNGPSS